jgi:hypothetical protein
MQLLEIIFYLEKKGMKIITKNALMRANFKRISINFHKKVFDFFYKKDQHMVNSGAGNLSGG